MRRRSVLISAGAGAVTNALPVGRTTQAEDSTPEATG